MSAQSFEDQWNAATQWAEAQAAHILAQGRQLTPAEEDLARRIGVKSPDHVRVLTVSPVPFPEAPALRAFAEKAKMDPESISGMTLFHGIFVRSDQAGNVTLLAHELRHVAQYECFGSIRAFMFFYLRELLHFGYGAGPLERDASAAESLTVGSGAQGRSDSLRPPTRTVASLLASADPEADALSERRPAISCCANRPRA